MADFQTWLHIPGIGKPLALELLRAGAPRRVTVQVAARPASATTR